MTELPPLQDDALPSGIRSRFVRDINGLRVHVLEAGFETRGRPLVLLLHGFPELAYSWRKVMQPLAAAGFRVVAPDQRGYGRTTGWDAEYDGDLGSFRILNAVRDALGLVSALGQRDVAPHHSCRAAGPQCSFRSASARRRPRAGRSDAGRRARSPPAP
jgi:alpha/beta hydrolase fold